VLALRTCLGDEKKKVMEADMLHAAGNALLIILNPLRMAYLVAGV
jgi:hypothetical protein